MLELFWWIKHTLNSIDKIRHDRKNSRINQWKVALLNPGFSLYSEPSQGHTQLFVRTPIFLRNTHFKD